ncbi:hypothetical protein [Paraclostridium sordellii]|uniref:hypothetical protein n=1 Tax=Paraclostridium sordellii TaxID=1505 RepID=UPI0005E14151|nr:hypothetical protein [Paeniclostridium sordellii]CEN94302.1 Uncharacterised protein [[Clostridium] sordellii] [Paeniclostridium sordellii]CEN94674.1 Uncharacterised protein [[Clostridium] sordellii] [Paeniclostridium sordellii]
MNTAFILRDSIYSFKKADVEVFINVCESLDINMIELNDKLNRQDLRALVHLMYFSLTDKKSLDIEDMYKLCLQELELMLELYTEVNTQ